MHLPDISILGLGYLGLPLAQKFYEQGSQVAAVKRNLTSDDINLPIELDIIDLNQDDIFHSSTLWQNHINKPTWFCLLPPSSLNHYADTLKNGFNLPSSPRYNTSSLPAAPACMATKHAYAMKPRRPIRKPNPPVKSSQSSKPCLKVSYPISTYCDWADFILPTVIPLPSWFKKHVFKAAINPSIFFIKTWLSKSFFRRPAKLTASVSAILSNPATQAGLNFILPKQPNSAYRLLISSLMTKATAKL